MKLKTLILGFVVFQLLYFPFNTDSFGLITIPLPGSVGFLLTVLTAVLIVLLTQSTKKRRAKIFYAKIALLFSLIFAFFSIFRANFIDRFILSAGGVSWGIIGLYLITLKQNRFGSLGELFTLPFQILSDFVQTLKNLFDSFIHWAFSKNKAKNSVSKFILGLFITTPVAAVLLLLLSSADPIFGHYVNNIFSLQFFRSQVLWNTVSRLIFSTIGFLLIAGFIYFKNSSTSRSPFNQFIPKNKTINIPFLMLSLVTCLILIVFLFIQFRYLFLLKNMADLSAYSIYTFSDYVKKGFFELLLTTLIIYTISGIGLIIYRGLKRDKLFLSINTLLIFLNFTLSISVLRRIYLYTDAHGLTKTRYYGIAILLVLMLLLTTLILRYFKSHNKLYILEMLGVSVIFFAFSSINSDYLIGKHTPPTVNQTLDYNYLAGLSPDGYQLWNEAIIEANKSTMLINQTPYGLDEKITIVRSYWAINKINFNLKRLDRIYKNLSITNIKEFNFQEYKAYKNMLNKVSLEEIDEILKLLAPTANYLIQNQEIPLDIFQYY